jgi:hypothetical protein
LRRESLLTAKLMCNVCDWRGVEAEADHLKDPRRVTRRTHARFTDLIVHFRMDWSVCRGTDDSCWTVCSGIDGSCWTVCAGIAGSRGGALCAINCFGAPLVGARGFLGFRPLLFGMELELPHFRRLYTLHFQDIAVPSMIWRAPVFPHTGDGMLPVGPAWLTFMCDAGSRAARWAGGLKRVSKAVAVARRASYVAAKRVSGVRLGGNWLGLEL